jgi:polyisoprenoid-binding protein YceI
MCKRVASATRWAFVVTLLGLGVSIGSARAATYVIDPSRSSLVLQLFRDGVAARLGHDHVVRATTFSGRVAYDPVAPDASSISLEVHTADLQVDDPATRQQFGLSGEPSAGDVTEIEKSMKAQSQLYVSKFPLIRFASNRITPEAPGRYLVTGQLTIRGAGQAVRFPATVRMEGTVFRATAMLQFRQSSFGYRPYSAALGAIKNKDEVRLHIDLAAVPE